MILFTSVPIRIMPIAEINARRQRLIESDPRRFGPQGRYPCRNGCGRYGSENPQMPTDLRTPEEKKSRLPGIYGKTIN